MPGLIKLFVNPACISSTKVESAYKQQGAYLRKVWGDDTYGLERLMRLFLCGVQFLFPILLVRELFGRRGATARRLAIEFYTFIKLILPLTVLALGLYTKPVVIVLLVYLLAETIVHILHLIFLSDVHAASVSYRRSILLLFLHYLEVVFDFAVMYIGFDLLSESLTPVSAVYFSLVANATVGFGDIHARSTPGQLVVIAQLLVCVLFLILFINYFSQKVNEEAG
jgi:hypothetical protein